MSIYDIICTIDYRRGRLMVIDSKLFKKIDETRYLTADNAWRYRTIMRYFYLQNEKMNYWLYKEDVFDDLKNHPEFGDYTIEQCSQDLTVLVGWKNLEAIQDTAKVQSLEEFKNKQFRYQLTEYSVQIERLTLRLENLHIESASLEPTLLERLRDIITKLPAIIYYNEKEIGAWWNDLNSDFKRLNQNYQDFIREWYSIRAEELMKTSSFIIYKDKLIDYLRDFIKGLQYHTPAIEQILTAITNEERDLLLEKVFHYEKSIPRLDVEDIELDLKDNIRGRWTSLTGWFVGTASEASKLLAMTNEIIRKLTRFAFQIVENQNSAANRKEEYRKLCELFLTCETIEDAHLLSSMTFGVSHMKHIKSNVERDSDSITSSMWMESPSSYTVKPRIRHYREKANREGIKNHRARKEAMRQEVLHQRLRERQQVEGYINEGRIDFSKLPKISRSVRTTLLKWLNLGLQSSNHEGKTEDGKVYSIITSKSKERCILDCEDGQFEMPNFIIQFKE